jgi:hypothetical protein
MELTHDNALIIEVTHMKFDHVLSVDCVCVCVGGGVYICKNSSTKLRDKINQTKMKVLSKWDT